MEKLSIEEKAKAYDKALERAQALYNDKNEIGYANAESVLEEVFPLLKESDDEKIRKEIIKYIEGTFPNEFSGIESKNKWIAWLEKQGKGKLTDKSKFKVGDWCIDNEDGTIFQIVKVFNDTYNYKTNEGKKYCCSHYSLENDARLWTIADAKDGDVLTNGDFPCIFKRCDDNGSLYVYCGINAHNDFSILSEDSENIWDDYSKQYFPATKEQRDLLFAKMKEAGYEWDADKKELKKADVELTDFEKSLKHIMIETLECGDTHNLKADAEMLLRFAQKPAEWSEEDERMIDNIIFELEENQENISGVGYKIDWLNSLKEKIGGKL